MYEYVLVGATTAVILYIWKKSSSSSDMNLPPGPEPSWLLGNVKDLDSDRVHQSLHQIAQQYGPVTYIRLATRSIVILNTTEVIRKAFTTAEFREHLNDKSKGFYGTYLVYGHVDVLLGPYTKTTFRMKDVMYKAIKPSMSSSQISRELTTLVERFQQNIGVDFSPNDVIDQLIAEALTILLKGEVMDGDTNMMWDFVNWSNKLLNPSMESLLKNLPFLRHFPGKPGYLYRTAKEKRDILLTRFLDESMTNGNENTARGLIDTCKSIQQSPDGDWLTDDMVKALILDTIGAGLVATSNLILASILNLLHHPECVRKMKKEINAVLGRSRLPAEDDEANLPYCFAVALETMRYSSIVPIVSHYCSTQDIEFEGHKITKGAMVWGNIWSAHHDDKTWSEPWSFQPERFLDQDGKLLPKDNPLRRNLIPLGVGPRECVGAKISMIRLFTYITTIIQHFNIQPPSDGDLKPCDPKLYTAGAVLQVSKYRMKIEAST